MVYRLPYKRIGGVTFQPWVGKVYEPTRCLLIVGMSHYSWGDADIPPWFVTNEVVSRRLKGEANLRFFTNIEATCKGRKLTIHERQEFWQSVAFYNYIQEFVGNAPRKKHICELWKRAEKPFLAVLRRLNPKLVLVVGRKNWNNISMKGRAGPALENAPERHYGDTWRYPITNGRTALAFHVKHTSSGYNFRKFAPLFRAAERAALSELVVK